MWLSTGRSSNLEVASRSYLLLAQKEQKNVTKRRLQLFKKTFSIDKLYDFLQLFILYINKIKLLMIQLTH